MDSTFCLFDDGRAADAAAAVRDPRSGGEVIDLEPTAALRDVDRRRGGDGDGLVAADDRGAGGDGAAKPSHAAVVGTQGDRFIRYGDHRGGDKGDKVVDAGGCGVTHRALAALSACGDQGPGRGVEDFNRGSGRGDAGACGRGENYLSARAERAGGGGELQA